MTPWVIKARQPETAGDPTIRNQPGEEIQAHGLLMPGCESSPHLDPLDWVGGDRIVMQKLCLAQRITSAIQVLPEAQGGFNVTKQALTLLRHLLHTIGTQAVGFISPFKVSVSQPNGSSCPVLKICLPVRLLAFLFQHPVTPTSCSSPG